MIHPNTRCLVIESSDSQGRHVSRSELEPSVFSEHISLKSILMLTPHSISVFKVNVLSQVSEPSS
jgi:hypothetical protein